MSFNVNNSQQPPHEKFLDNVKSKTQDPPKTDKPSTEKPKIDIKKDIMMDGGFNPNKKPSPIVINNISEVTGHLFPVDGIKLAKSILKESDPKKQLSLLMNFTKELDNMSSEQLSELKGYLIAKKESSNDPETSILKKLSFSNDDILDSMLSAVDKEIGSRKAHVKPIIRSLED